MSAVDLFLHRQAGAIVGLDDAESTRHLVALDCNVHSVHEPTHVVCVRVCVCVSLCVP